MSYKTGGPLTEHDDNIYIVRAADQDLVKNLQLMNYVLVVEPRQQGKTSLINRLLYQNTFPNYIFVYIDVSSCIHSGEQGWYQTLCGRIIYQLQAKYKLIPNMKLPKNSIEWREFLRYLAGLIKDNNKRIVIVLDEIGSASFPGASGFFIVLRDIYNSRQIEQEFREISFVLMGTFHPRNLISDDTISPFNIAQQVILTDFNVEQIQRLLSLSKGSENIEELAERIYFWTNGQPYLTQLICSYINQKKHSIDEIDKSIAYILREDKNHIPSLLIRLTHAPQSIDYLRRILNGERVKFFPGANPIQEELRLLGLLSDDHDGYCCIRNKIYQLALKASHQSSFDVFICHNSDDKPTVRKISKRLIDANITPWLDEWELPPGTPWQRLLEAQIGQIKSVAVFVGENGIGPWQQMEIEAFLREFIKRGCPVIPVLLQSAVQVPDLPIFLAGMTWVDFRQKDPDPMKQLIWGITGKKSKK